MNRRVVLASAVAGLALAPASAAADGTVTFDSPCYYSASTVNVSGVGWPSAAKIVLTDPNPLATLTSESNSTFVGTFKAPTLNPDTPAVHRYTVTATAPSTGQTATGSFFDVAPAVDANLNGKPSSSVVWTIAGFQGGQTVYGHWVFDHKSLKTLKMGKVPGACGLVKHKAPRIPVAPRPGQWTAQFDASRTYHSSSPHVSLHFRDVQG